MPTLDIALGGQRYAGAAVEVAGFLALVPTLSMLAAWHVLGCIATAGWTFAVDALVVLPAFYFFDRARFRKHVLAMVLFAAFSGLVVTATKIAVDRQRPPEYFASLGIDMHVPGAVPVDKSFPSGHTQIAFAIAVYLSCIYRSYALLFLLVAGLVGLSRIALGVHFPVDVAAGACIGAVFSLGGYRWAMRKQKHPT